jgi:hypothetical protein
MRSNHLSTVMPALVAGIDIFLAPTLPSPASGGGEGGGDVPGHDSGKVV